MDWTVLAVAAVGVAGTAAGTVLGPLVTARQSERTWLRQRRVELYSDALVHAEAAERLRWRMIEPEFGEGYDVGGRPEPAPPELIGARMSLYGDVKAREAWGAFLLAWSSLRFRVEQDFGGAPLPRFDEDDPGLVQLGTAIEELSKVCRREVS